MLSQNPGKPTSVLANLLVLDRDASLAVSCKGVALSRAQLAMWAQSLAYEMRFCAERPVGILAPSSLEYVAALLGVWRAGGIAVPLQPAHPTAELQYIVSDTGITDIWCHSSCVSSAAPLKGVRAHLIKESNVETTSRDSVPDTSQEALIIYTSGTTSRPKGVVSTFGNLEAQISSLLHAWQWSEHDRTLNVLPLHHVHGVVNVLCCALAARAQCEMSQGFDADYVWRQIAAGKLTVFMAVPTIYTRLIQHFENQSRDVQTAWTAAASKLRLMVSGSAALATPTFARWAEISGHRLLERYGMTEIGMALSNPYEGERKPGYVGTPLPGVQARLVDDAGHEIFASEIPGELHIKGASVFKEYWAKPQATHEAFTADGWFKTGDIAVRAADGTYRLLGRSSQDIIKCGGYKISALEIESVLLAHPRVHEAAVVGLADAEYGERVAAACVADYSVTEEELVGWLKVQLAHYKIPTRWLWVHKLPRNAMGKIVKPEVRKLFPGR